MQQATIAIFLFTRCIVCLRLAFDSSTDTFNCRFGHWRSPFWLDKPLSPWLFGRSGPSNKLVPIGEMDEEGKYFLFSDREYLPVSLIILFPTTYPELSSPLLALGEKNWWWRWSQRGKRLEGIKNFALIEFFGPRENSERKREENFRPRPRSADNRRIGRCKPATCPPTPLENA